MATPTMLWTALPNGVVGGGAVRLSIFVSPRFSDAAATTLGDYTLGNWPSNVLSMAQNQLLRVRFGPLATGPSFVLGVSISDLMPALWDALLPPTTRVRPFQFRDHSRRSLRSFSVRAIQRYIEGVYTAVANDSPTDYPDLNGNNQAATLVSVLGAVMGRVTDLTRTTGIGGPRYIPPLPPGIAQPANPGPHPDAPLEAQLDAMVPNGAGVPASEFYRAYRFYNRGQQEKYRSQFAPRVVSDIPAPLQRPSFDFHQVLAALGDHPAILRRLGFILDCVVTGVDVATLSAFSQIKIDVLLAGGAPSPTDQSPWTRYEPASFVVAPSAGSELRDGYLTLGDAQLFDVFQSDADANALRTLDYAVNMAGVVATRKAENAVLDCASGQFGPNPARKEPQSLPALRGNGFTVTRSGRDQAVSQRLGSAKTHDASPPDAVLFHEDVVRGYRVDVQYHGRWFSLCQRVPSYAIGSLIVAPGQDEGYVKAASGTSAPKDPPSGPPAEKDLYLHEALFGWHNWSLVVARPGRSISFDRNDADRTQTVAVRRETSPLDPEFPLAISARVPDKTLPPLRFGESYRFRARAVDLAGNSRPLTDTLDPGQAFSAPAVFVRHEPVATPALVLRAPLTPGESVEHLVIRSKAGTDPIPNETAIFNPTAERHVAPPKTSQLMAELHGAFDAYFATPSAAYAVAVKEQGTFQDPGGDIKLIDASGAEVDPAPLNQKGAPLPDGHYVIHTTAQLPLPYLPEPVVSGAALAPPGGSLLTKDYAGAWPTLSTFRLVLSAASGNTPSYDTGDPLSVRLPRGTMLTLRYSSTIAASKLALFARWNAMSAAARGAVTAAGGQHWMLTPYRELTFVHAVEKPLSQPTIDPNLIIGRSLGDTFATLRGIIQNHAPSTGQLELFSAWSEMVDRPSLPAPGAESRSGRVFDRKVDYDETAAVIPSPRTCDPVRHEFGDTKHRWVRYHALGTTRYREYFPTIATNPALLSLAGPETELVNIPSSARPAPPKVLYILPIFKWESSSDKKSSTRRGRGLRIYVERPWYVSGDDELLGVIIPPPGNVPAELQKYVSQWGSDPIWSAAGPSVELSPDHFVQDPNDKTTTLTIKEGVQLAEVDPGRGDLLATAVGIQPQYNAERRLHYFDLELDPGTAYFPFVRLVLARFQPYSLDGAHLSTLVRTEFAQLVADRTASIAYQGVTSVDVTVSGVVATNQAGAKVHARADYGARGPTDGFVAAPGAGDGRLVLAHVERQEIPAQGELGWEAVGGAVVLPCYSMSSTPGVVHFRGNVALPKTLSDGAAYRLVVRELEVFETDLLVHEKGLPIDNPKNVPVRSRLVYADMLPLSAV